MYKKIFVLTIISVFMILPAVTYAAENIVDDFDDGADPTYWGGSTWGGTSTNDAETSTMTYESSVQHTPSSGNSLNFDWSSIDGAGEWAVVGIVDLDNDVSGYDTFSFWIYTPNYNTDMLVVLQSTTGAATAGKVNLTDYVQTGINTWQNVSIPISAFTRENTSLDITHIGEIKWEAATDSGNDQSGSIYIDDIKFASENNAPANSIIFSGGDKGTSQVDDIAGDTLIWWDQASASATTNQTEVKVSTVYAVGWVSTPSDKSSNKNESVYFSYEIRNDGNIVDTIVFSTEVINGENWALDIYWDKNENGSYDAGTDTDSWNSIGTLPGSTYYFLVKVDIPSDAVDGDSTTIRITAKDNFGDGTNDSWPTASDDDTITDDFQLTCSIPIALVIDEIGWNGADSGDALVGTADYIEIWNNTSNDIDISGYYISDGGGNDLHWSAGTIPANGYWVVVDTGGVDQVVGNTLYTFDGNDDNGAAMSLPGTDAAIGIASADTGGFASNLDKIIDFVAYTDGTDTPASGVTTDVNNAISQGVWDLYGSGSTNNNWTADSDAQPGVVISENFIRRTSTDAPSDLASNWEAVASADISTTTAAPGDARSPSDIVNLTALPGDSEDGSIVLYWTAPGDDADLGTAASYEIKASSVTNIADDTDYTAASLLSVFSNSSVPDPSSGGTEESFTVTGLTKGVTYYFAIKATDESSQTSSWTSGGGTNTANYAIASDTAPAVPSGFTVQSAADSYVNLAWDANTEDDFSEYEIDFSSYSDSTGWQDLISTTSLTYAHSGLDSQNTYYYRIKSWDTGNNGSDWSSVLSTMTYAPSNLSIVKSTSVASAKPGDTITYTLTYANTGGVAADNIQIIDVIPANTVLLNNTTNPAGETIEYYYSSNWNSGYDSSAEKVKWKRTSLGPNVGNQQVQFDVQVE